MSMQLRKNTNVASNEQGFASIVIALVMIVVLALLTVGFAQLARREQQGALAKQLSTEAYYAAESGINDTRQDINDGAICSSSISPTCLTTDANSTTCMTGLTGSVGTTRSLPASALTANPNVDGNNGVSYSCLLVNLTPSSLVFNETQPGTGQNLAFSTISSPGNTLSSLTIQWESQDGHSSASLTSGTYAPGKFPSSAIWNANPNPKPPVLQFSLTPTNSGGAISRGSLIDSTFNTYLYPAHDGSGTVAYNPTLQGQIVSGNCGNTGSSYPCSVTITGLNAPGIGTSFLLHYLDFYDASNVYITGTSTGALGNQPVTFTGEVQVDVTGKAQNVLKRLQVRLDASGTNGSIVDPPLLPDNALQAQNICKRLETRPAVNNPNPSPPNTDYISPIGTNVDASPVDACNLNN